MSLERRGFVGLFTEPLIQSRIEELVLVWRTRFGAIEQAIGTHGQALTISIKEERDIVWEDNLQFRVLAGEQFTWIYIARDRHVIETSGLTSADGSMLCRDVLQDLDGCAEIIDEHNERRLDELESRGLM
jgi:hypothetical protein